MKDENFTQIVVWEACVLNEATQVEEFEEYFKKQGFDVKYVAQFNTLPGQGGGGGRNDLLFRLHGNNVSQFAIWRLQHQGMRWWEDYVDNNTDIIPTVILEKYPKTW